MKTEMKYGLIIAAVSAIWLIVQDLIGLHDKYIQYQSMVSWLGLIIPIAGLFFAIKEKRDKEFEGSISYGQCIKTGLLTTIVNGFLGSIFGLLFFKFINPKFLTALLELQHQELLDKNLPPESVDAAMGMMEMMFSPAMMTIMGFFITLIGGLIVSLILGAILKKDPPPFEA